MLEKEKIFSKFNVTDYNVKLEEIFEKKQFSEEAENLLFSMFYKIESCYKDYETVKNENNTEKDFFEKLINIIEYKCDEIVVMKPIIGKECPKYKVDKKKKKIAIFPNEVYLLTALFKLGSYVPKKENDITFISRCMLTILNEGKAVSDSEVIRDFLGWTWEISFKEIENVENMIFNKNLEFLLDSVYMKSNMCNIDIEHTIEEKFVYLFGKVQGKIAIKKMQQFLLAIYSNGNVARKRNVLLHIKKIEAKLRILENKTEFLNNLKTINDKKIKRVKKIDKILSNIEYIRKEFVRRNQLLPENEKIFSISQLVEILNSDRQRTVRIINDNNNLMNPLNYTRKLNDVKNELKKYRELNITKNSNADLDKYLIEFQRIFYEGMSKKIKNANNKKDLINLTYQFRYYNLIPYKNGIKLKFDKRIQEQWEEICIELAEKLLDEGIIDVMAEDGELNYNIIKYIFLTKIMKLENINVKLRKYNNKLEVEYFDGNTLEDKIEIEVKDLQNIKIKTERKTKLFI